ncbi:Protein disulfide-isomerase 5-4 [Senna tora]|uniref:Protein disulfide-isomerase 5-4 n=1 Tax=Senna tora TaxID=362788 RepID=A0A835CBE2_9FABA|nr:Protein disulfide-isomerase 5-4 [Senna tora]
MERAATIDNPAPDIDASVKSLGIFLSPEDRSIGGSNGGGSSSCGTHSRGCRACCGSGESIITVDMALEDLLVVATEVAGLVVVHMVVDVELVVEVEKGVVTMDITLESPPSPS